MKKAVVSLIILLIAAGAVFYLGWVQFAVPAGSCGVMISKTGGVYAEPITSGKFIWRWERLLPTNTELRIFNLTPVTVAETITSSLPSAALYSTVIAGELDFSYSVEIKTTAKLAPDAVLQLVKKNDIKTQTELDTTVTSLIKQFNRTVVDFILQQESGVAADGNSPLSFTTESLLDSIDVGNLFPGLEVTFVEISSVTVPDITLYRAVRDMYLAEQQLQVRESGEPAAELKQGNPMSSLADMGELLTKYPGLLELLTTSESNFDKLIQFLERSQSQ